MARVTPWLARPSLVGSLVQRVRLSLRLLREPRVSLLAKAIPVAAAVYLVSPLDLAPDFLPILGQLDDLGILFVALESFLHLCPAAAVDFHKSALAEGRKYSPMPAGADYIDATWRREPREPRPSTRPAQSGGLAQGAPRTPSDLE